jgi:hypothetical protein
MFEALGLIPDTFAVYQTLLQRPDLIRIAHRNELAAAAGISEDAVERHLDRLRELGLLVPRRNIPDEEYLLHPRGDSTPSSIGGNNKSTNFPPTCAKKRRPPEDSSPTTPNSSLIIIPAE